MLDLYHTFFSLQRFRTGKFYFKRSCYSARDFGPFLLLFLSVQEHPFHLVFAIGIGHVFVGSNGLGDVEIGAFPDGYATQTVAYPHGITTVDGSGIESLLGEHTIVDASKRNDELHIARRR